MSKHDWTTDPTIAPTISDHLEQAERYRLEAALHEEQALKLIEGWTLDSMTATREKRFKMAMSRYRAMRPTNG